MPLWTVVCTGLASLAFWAPSSARALQSATLSWGTINSPDVGGYNVYYGTQSGVYPNRLSAGNVGSTRVSGLQEGTTYYFVVTVYDLDGFESDPSNEAIYTVPGTSGPPLTITALTSKAFVLDYTGTASGPWLIEMSGDFWTWYTVAMGTNSTARVAVLLADADQMFFRLKSPTPGVRLLKSVLPGAFPNSFALTVDGVSPLQWELEASTDLEQWVPFTSATNAPLNASVILTSATGICFRLHKL